MKTLFVIFAVLSCITTYASDYIENVKSLKRDLSHLEDDIKAEQNALCRKITTLTNDASMFMSLYDSIIIKDVNVKTNEYVSCGGKAKIIKIKKNRLEDYQVKIQKILAFSGLPEIAELYKKYAKRDISAFIDEFKCEFNSEKENFKNVTLKIREIDNAENSEIKMHNSSYLSRKDSKISDNNKLISDLELKRGRIGNMIRDVRQEISRTNKSYYNAIVETNKKSAERERERLNSKLKELESEYAEVQSQLFLAQAENRTMAESKENTKETARIVGVRQKYEGKRNNVIVDNEYRIALKQIADKYEMILFDRTINAIERECIYCENRTKENVSRLVAIKAILNNDVKIPESVANDYHDREVNKVLQSLGIENREYHLKRQKQSDNDELCRKQHENALKRADVAYEDEERHHQESRADFKEFLDKKYKHEEKMCELDSDSYLIAEVSDSSMFPIVDKIAGVSFGKTFKRLTPSNRDSNMNRMMFVEPAFLGVFNKVKISVNQKHKCYSLRFISDMNLNREQKFKIRNKIVEYFNKTHGIFQYTNTNKNWRFEYSTSDEHLGYHNEKLYIGLGFNGNIESSIFLDVERKDLSK